MPSILQKLFGGAKPRPLSTAITRFAGRAMLILPAHLDAMLATAADMPATEAMRDADDWSPHGSKPEHLIEIVDGIGIITIRGPLFQRFDWLCYVYDGTAYEMISAAFRRLVADERVRGIVLDIDTGGGEVSGCFDLTDEMFAARGTKPIRAIINDNAFSAGYSLASAADEIWITRTGGAGSIGVRSTHLDISKWDADVGLKYTTIVAGEKKADFDIHAPLSAGAAADLQAEVDRLYGIFVDTVARNRGLQADAVRSTEAGCFFGEGVIALGLADRLGTLADLLGEADAAVSTATAEDVPAEDDDAAPEPEASVMPTPRAASPATRPTAAQAAATDRAAVADAVVAAGVDADLTVALLTPASNVTSQNVEQRLEHARAVAEICDTAGVRSAASDYVKQGTPIETVRQQLLGMRAESGPAITTILPGNGGQAPTGGAAKRQTVYDRRRAAAAASGK